ncbi:MAG: AAA family ATPase [Deltaproteobacteria bacterium]|nr:AAA family ATPase [Deltaproteobacteria bacterium]
MKLLPFSLQTFQNIITGGYVYVDKTKYVYDAVSKGKAYFLSRPRRFGKSLLLSTFKALFSGPTDPNGPPQGLFAGLWISQTDYDFTQRYTVINLDISGESNSPEELKENLKIELEDLAAQENLDISSSLPGSMLSKLIKGLSRKHGTTVVVLIDEYDAPVSDNLDNIDLAKANQKILKDFYQCPQLKEAKGHP